MKDFARHRGVPALAVQHHHAHVAAVLAEHRVDAPVIALALDGVSLTIGKTGKISVTVYLIPHTLKMTTLGSRRTGDEVNVEFDMIGKYIANMVEKKQIS